MQHCNACNITFVATAGLNVLSMLHCCLGQILSRCPTSALLTGLTRNKLPCRASAENRPAAAASNADSADVPNMDRNALEPTVPAGATQNASDAAKAPDLSSPLQAQEKPSLAKCVPKTPITTPDVVITASEPNKQASSFQSSLSVPSSCKPPPSSAGKHALTPFGKSQSKVVFRSTTSSPLSAPAFKAVNVPPLTQPARAALAIPLSAAKSTAVPGTKATITLPSQHSSIKQPTAQGLAGSAQKLSSSLTSASIGKSKDAGNKGAPAGQAPFKFSSLPVPQSKPTNATGGAALHGFPKLSARISGGSTRSPDVPLPSFGSTPVQTAARSKPSGMSSDPTVLPGPQCVTIAVSLSKSAGAAAIPVRLPVSSVPAVPKAASPQLPVPGPAHSIDTDQQLSPIAGITRTPPVKQAQQQQPSLPQTSGPAVSASHRDVQMSAPVEQDAVMGKEGENSLPTTKPWTSTSLAGGLMGNMKNLEAVRYSMLVNICVSFAIFSICTCVVPPFALT